MTSFYAENELASLGLSSYGKNVLISRKASFYGASRISIGNNVRIDDFCILSGTIKIGNNVHIAAYVSLFGGNTGIVLDDFTGVSSRCAIYAESDDYSGCALTNPTIPEEFLQITKKTVFLRKHALIGTGSTILPGCDIGEGSSVGSMSLVTKSLDPWGIYVGIPCKRIKDRSKDLLKLEEEYLNSLSANS